MNEPYAVCKAGARGSARDRGLRTTCGSKVPRSGTGDEPLDPCGSSTSRIKMRCASGICDGTGVSIRNPSCKVGGDAYLTLLHSMSSGRGEAHHCL